MCIHILSNWVSHITHIHIYARCSLAPSALSLLFDLSRRRCWSMNKDCLAELVGEDGLLWDIIYYIYVYYGIIMYMYIVYIYTRTCLRARACVCVNE